VLAQADGGIHHAVHDRSEGFRNEADLHGTSLQQPTEQPTSGTLRRDER
jgi:hypothetical protein